MEKISVVVPVYNTAEYLRKCLDSLVNQTYSEVEILLVDDGSTDNSGLICDEYQARYPQRVRVWHQPNGGSSAARNLALDRAEGSYLAFVDSDDFIESDALEFLMNLLRKHRADMAVGEMWIEKSETDRRVCVESDEEYCWNTKEALIQLNSYRYLHKSFCTGLFKRDAIGELRFPVGMRCEDYSLLYQVMGRCKTVAYSSRPLYHYVQRYGSNSRTTSISLAPMQIAQEQIRYFQKCFPEILFSAESDCVFEYMGIYTAYVRNGLKCPAKLRKELQKTARRYLGSALKNSWIPGIKKIQAIVFCCVLPLYDYVIARTEHR